MIYLFNYKRLIIYFLFFIAVAFLKDRTTIGLLMLVMILAFELTVKYENKDKYRKIKSLLEQKDLNEKSITDIDINDYSDAENQRIVEEIISLIGRLRIREEKLSYENEYIKNVIEIIDGALVTISDEDIIVFASTCFFDIFKLEKEKIINKNLKSNKKTETIFLKIKEAIENKKEEIEVYNKVYSFKQKELKGNLKDRIILIKDITEEKKMKNIIIETEKVLALRDFASGVAHEIRNPLMPIKGLLQIIKERIKDENKTFTQYLDIIFQEINSINSKIEKLDQFAEIEEYKKQEEEVDGILIESISKLKKEKCFMTREIEIKIDLQLENIKLILSREKIEKVFFNILKNACEAIEKKGVIIVKTYIEEDNKVVEISDNGIGISQEIISKVNTPFYSTKVKTKSLGLGLPIAFKIIHEHDGKIFIESEKNKGTTVKVVFN